MAMLYVQTVQPTDLNKNTEWFMYPGVWTIYILILFFYWLLVLSVFGCSPGMAWTVVNLSHFAVTYYFFHWEKGTPFADDQGIYNNLTWWEQIDNGKQLTRNRKFMIVVPVVLDDNGSGWGGFGQIQNPPRLPLDPPRPVNPAGRVRYKLKLASTICIPTAGYFHVLDRYLIASHTTNYHHPMLFLNTLAVAILVIAKFPNMHKVRIFGING
ncbi:hypothetical protein ZIOFF_020134 [Zingiber officinale]|uniref:ORM1-like protein 2 n=1 Tax=Zingiber officinale TaxID=94328 RepID=A0A8J5HT53_ZINOF|nr:hypothetical protein ZIOFF_020134 [Zingiber officinale]